MNIIPFPSSNFNERQFPEPDMIVIHYTGMKTAQDALDRMTSQDQPCVSAHYFIDRTGKIFQLVCETKRAWHAGISCWEKIYDVNSRSIGIELENKGFEFGYQNFPAQQIDSLIRLLDRIRGRFDIKDKNIIGHSDIAPLRKKDPGYLFPWHQLARKGHGIHPIQLKNSLYTNNRSEFFNNLALWGYECDILSYFTPLNRCIYNSFMKKINFIHRD